MNHKEEFEDGVITIYNGDTPADSNQKTANVLKMLEEGVSVQQISISLGMDIHKVGAIASTFEREKFKNMDRQEMMVNNVQILNECIHIAQCFFMQTSSPQAAQSLALLIQTQLNVADSLDSKDDPEIMRKKLLEGVMQPLVEGVVVRMTKEISKTRDIIQELTPEDKHELVGNHIKGMMDSLGGILTELYKEASTSLVSILKGPKKKNDKSNRMDPNKSILNDLKR